MKPSICYNAIDPKGNLIGHLDLLGFTWVCRYKSEKLYANAFLDMDKAKESFGPCKLIRELSREKTGSFIK